MKKNILLALATTLLLFGCKSDDSEAEIPKENKALILIVNHYNDYFEGGAEMIFPESTATFSIHKEYIAPNPDGSIKLIYSELSQTLFQGVYSADGKGRVLVPGALIPSYKFTITDTKDYVMPYKGFEQILTEPTQKTPDYNPAWGAVQEHTEVREYLQSNPNQKITVIYFDPLENINIPPDQIIYLNNNSKWIFILKN